MQTAGTAVRISAAPLRPELTSLAEWPYDERLIGVDLNLSDRSRVSALPWRGQFSPETVERLLDAFATTTVEALIDPFVGSGTSLLEAARRGIAATGVDVNPAAVAYARVASLASVAPRERRERLDLLAEWCDGAGSRCVADVLDELAAEPMSDKHTVALLSATPPPLSLARLGESVSRLRSISTALPSIPVPIGAVLGDARDTKLPPASFDVAVTSPPYINVFNYHQYGRPVTDRLGWRVLDAARSEIGSNRQNRGNRFRTVVQYTLDMALALCELRRLLKADATAVLVVGRESNVRGVPFFNGEILARLAEVLGLFASHTRAERVFVSRFGGRIYEDVLVLKRPQSTPTRDAALAAAHKVAEAVLREASTTDSDVAADLSAALIDEPLIQPSPCPL